MEVALDIVSEPVPKVPGAAQSGARLRLLVPKKSLVRRSLAPAEVWKTIIKQHIKTISSLIGP
jgi:hypothetical protein